jgi:hypothetical protein
MLSENQGPPKGAPDLIRLLEPVLHFSAADLNFSGLKNKDVDIGLLATNGCLTQFALCMGDGWPGNQGSPTRRQSQVLDAD